jgi:hypothetical protein
VPFSTDEENFATASAVPTAAVYFARTKEVTGAFARGRHVFVVLMFVRHFLLMPGTLGRLHLSQRPNG